MARNTMNLTSIFVFYANIHAGCIIIIIHNVNNISAFYIKSAIYLWKISGISEQRDVIVQEFQKTFIVPGENQSDDNTKRVNLLSFIFTITD